MPISQVDENMERAEKTQAYLKQKFYFRTNIVKQGTDYKECKL